MRIIPAELVEAVASQIAAAITDDGKVQIGHTDEHNIVHISHYPERSHEAILRTDSGEAWVLRVGKLGEHMHYSGNDDEIKVRKSYAKYHELSKELARMQQTAKAMGIEDVDLLVQAWHDEVLNDTEREHWGRWVSGGYASDTEWAMVEGERPAPRRTAEDEIDEMRV